MTIQFSDSSFLASALELLLLAPHSHFLPAKLQLATSRLLLYLSLDPAFFASQASTSNSSTLFPVTSAISGVDIAKQSDEFRRGVIRSLLAAIQSGVGAQGVVDRAAEVWRKGIADGDDVVRCLSLRCRMTRRLPTLPPVGQGHLRCWSRTSVDRRPSVLTSSSTEHNFGPSEG